jgi:hypothetical protein
LDFSGTVEAYHSVIVGFTRRTLDTTLTVSELFSLVDHRRLMERSHIAGSATQHVKKLLENP